MVAGTLSFVLFLILGVISLLDATEIMGVNRWIKPMKFTISPAIYMWTLAVYLYFLQGFAKSKKLISSGVIITMTGEIFLIIMQAVRGTTSHFNISNGFDASVFALMGILIFINTLLVVYLLFLYFRADADLPKSIVWAMRFGIILFILAAFEGGVMSSLLRHNIGVADGGKGLPFLNWSTAGGDLRVAHFIGMHALQVIPFFAYLLERYEFRETTKLTVGFAFLYFFLFTFVFVQALFGKPLFSWF